MWLLKQTVMKIRLGYLGLFFLFWVSLTNCNCPGPSVPFCETDADCSSDRICVEGICKDPTDGGGSREKLFIEEMAVAKEEAGFEKEMVSDLPPEPVEEKKFDCKDACSTAGEQRCTSSSPGFQTCQRAQSGCLKWSTPTKCPANNICQSGYCICPNKACGSACCLLGQTCYNNICCSPSCNGKQCGSDGCGGACKPGCSSDQICRDEKCANVTLKPGEVLIKSGTFMMGSPDSELGRYPDGREGPQHKVTLMHSFAMGKYELTQKEFKTLMGYNPSGNVYCRDNCPVESVNWYEALAFCNMLSKARNLSECFDCTGSKSRVFCQTKKAYTGNSGKDYYTCKGYRLPTEAEWEYAYRAGTTTAFYNGNLASNSGPDPNLDKIGWYFSNSKNLMHPVGKKLPNAWGLYDMAGNVKEWVFDSGLSTYTSSPVTNPIYTTGLGWVMRGGAFSSSPEGCRASWRALIGAAQYNLGFRVCRTL